MGIDRYDFYLRGEIPPGWAPNIWANYCQMIAPLESLHRARFAQKEAQMIGHKPHAFQGNDDEPLDLSNPPKAFSAVTKPQGNEMFTVGSKAPDWDEITPYTDFDGAQARVSNDVLYVTWTAPTTKKKNLVMMPLEQIASADVTEEDGGMVLYCGERSVFVSCAKGWELAKWIGRALEIQRLTSEPCAIAVPMCND